MVAQAHEWEALGCPEQERAVSTGWGLGAHAARSLSPRPAPPLSPKRLQWSSPLRFLDVCS